MRNTGCPAIFLWPAVIARGAGRAAASVDASGEFPRKQVDALGAAGLLALTVPATCGGGGAGLREAAAEAADLALRAGGGSAYRKESPVERLFRDSRAARVMSPTTEHLQDFIGRALLGLPLRGEV